MKTVARIGSLLVMVMISMANIQAKEPKNGIEAIVSLGKEMSNMRAMLENYTLIGAKITFKDPKARLRDSIKAHEVLLDQLDKNFQNPIIQEAIKDGRIKWKVFKKYLQTALEETDREEMRKTAQLVHDNVRSIVVGLSKMKKHFLKKESCVNPDELNAAVEISTSARRLSAHYMMKMWDLPDPTIEEHWHAGVKKYKDGIDLLKKSSHYKDTEFKSWLDKTEKILNYAIMSFSMASESGVFSPSIIHDKCEEAYEIGNKMVDKIVSGRK